MKNLEHAENRLNTLIKHELGEVKRVFKSNHKLFIEFHNGMNLQLHRDEIKHQAIEHLASTEEYLHSKAKELLDEMGFNCSLCEVNTSILNKEYKAKVNELRNKFEELK